MKCSKKPLLLLAILIAFNYGNAQPAKWDCAGKHKQIQEHVLHPFMPASTTYATKYVGVFGYVPIPSTTPTKIIRFFPFLSKER